MSEREASARRARGGREAGASKASARGGHEVGLSVSPPPSSRTSAAAAAVAAVTAAAGAAATMTSRGVATTAGDGGAAAAVASGGAAVCLAFLASPPYAPHSLNQVSESVREFHVCAGLCGAFCGLDWLAGRSVHASCSSKCVRLRVAHTPTVCALHDVHSRVARCRFFYT